MSTAVIALTFKRVEATEQVWANNLKNRSYLLSAHNPVYWWDNTPHGPEREALVQIAANYHINHAFHDGSNYGIAHPINRMAERIFADGHDGFVTMASDIMEPANWIEHRSSFAAMLPAGIVAIPPGKHHTAVARYPRQEHNGIGYEHGGDIIGNWYVSKEAYEKIGQFPEHYGIYGPIDLEYCARARKAGILAVYLSDLEANCIPVQDDPEYILAKNKSLAEAWPIYSNVMSNL